MFFSDQQWPGVTRIYITELSADAALVHKEKGFFQSKSDLSEPSTQCPSVEKKKSDNKKVSALEKRNGTLVIKEE